MATIEAFRRLLLAAIALLFVYQVGASTWRIVALGARDLAREGQFDTEEERMQRAFGEDWRHFVVLRDTLPDDALFICTLRTPLGRPDTERDALLLNRLRHALHPRMVYGIDFADPKDRASFPTDAAAIPANVYVAFFPRGGKAPPPAPFVELSDHDGMQIWGAAMTLPIWHLVIMLAAPFFLGVPLARWLGLRVADDRLRFCAASWLAGTFATAALTFAWLATHKPVPGPWLAPLTLLVGIGLSIATRSKDDTVRRRPRSSEDLVLTVTVAVLAAWILVRLFALNVQPVLFGDEANIFAQRAKVLFMSDGLGLEWMRSQALLDVKHSDYPLFDPLLHTWVYAGADRITHVDNRWPIQLFTFSLLLALASALRQHVRPGCAAAILVLFFGMGIFDLNIGPSRAEMILSTGILMTVDAWLRWHRSRRPADWRFACVALAATLWAKNEGQLLAVALVSALLLARCVRSIDAIVPSLRAAAWLLVPGALLVGHHAFNAHASVHNDLFDPNTGGGFFTRFVAQFGDRWLEVPTFFSRELLGHPARFGQLVPMLLLLGLGWPRRVLGRPALVPIALAVVALIGFQAVFVATPFDLAWHLPTAADRTVLHTMSVATLGFAMAVAAVVRGSPPHRTQRPTRRRDRG